MTGAGAESPGPPARMTAETVGRIARRQTRWRQVLTGVSPPVAECVAQRLRGHAKEIDKCRPRNDSEHCPGDRGCDNARDQARNRQGEIAARDEPTDRRPRSSPTRSAQEVPARALRPGADEAGEQSANSRRSRRLPN